MYLLLCLHWLVVRWSLCACVPVYTHAPTVTTVCLEPSALHSLRTQPQALRPDSSRPHPHPRPSQPLTSMLLSGVTHHMPHPPHLAGRWQGWSVSCPWRERVGGSGERRRLGGPLEAERTLYSVPFRLSLTQLSYSFAAVHRCPAATAPAGVPGTPQPGHCASSGPRPHPILTCRSWEHEEPPRPAH